MIEKNVKLYLGDGYPVRIPVSQFDTMWRFVFSIVYNSQPWIIPSSGGSLDTTAILNGRKPDGNVFAFAGTINGDNTVTVDCDVQMTAVAGPTVCELSILSDGKVAGTANFILDVEAAPKSPDDVSSETTLPAYGEILDRIVEIEGGGGGGSVTVDDALSGTSENPVQNKAIYKAIENLHGENILFNGLPHRSNTSGTGDAFGWNYSRGSSSTDIQAIAGEYFQTVFPVGITAADARIQLLKYLLAYGEAGRGPELDRVRSGESVAISFELESDVKLEYLRAKLQASADDGGTVSGRIYLIDSGTSINATEGKWVVFEGHGVVPDWWDAAKQDQYTKTLGLIIEFKASDTDFDGTVAKTVRIRNIKLEYGNRCTPFSHSTLDLDDMAKMVDAKAEADEVYCDGKNLLVNGKPMYNLQSGGTSEVPQEDNGWGFAVADDDTVHEVAGEYFQFTVPYGTSGVRTLQLNKPYKMANVIYHYADNDLLKIVGGRKATISFELKSNVAFELVERLRVMSQDSQTLLTLFSISDKNLGQITSWQRFTATDVFPSDFVDVFTGAEASTSRLYFQFKVDTANLSPNTDGEIYLRNIKLEYGDTATDFTYSDRDVTNILSKHDKIVAPASATAGQFLVYNGIEWVAQTVPNASGVSF